jgi:transcription-repair coupling factor (superfamily II helicase)
MFARCAGPAVLLTTAERAPLFLDAFVFGALRSVDPHLADWPERRDKVVLTLEHALKAFPDDPEGYALELVRGAEYSRAELQERLERFGYERDEVPGYSVRGDTLTIFREDPGESEGVRLEFFGDELDRIARGEETHERLLLTPLPGAPAEDDHGWTARLIEKLHGPVFLDSPELVAGELGGERSEWLWRHLRGRRVVSFGRDPLDLAVEPGGYEPLGYYRGRLTELSADLEGWLADGYSVTLLLKFERSGRYLRERVVDHLESRWCNRVERHPGVLGLALAPGAAGGYRNDREREVVLTEELLYGHQGGRKLKRLPGRSVGDAAQLSVGDYLIHPDHGIGRFQGLEPRQVVGVTRDYLILRYAGEGKLYLPVEQLPLLRRHPGTTDDPPRLSTLGTNEWARARERARASAQELAARLIKTYAQRQVTPGVALPPVPDWDRLIAENFPFDLTPDQATAAEATLDDMAKPVPMDRLISGDVGFGKTEVAIRAAHRAVGNGKQAAMLVPTTVLAKQHYQTIAERFRDLPVEVRMLSRFTGDREANEVIRGLADGSVDIVVGTHRLLAEGVSFKDLGLLVIDEEHRFGVGQKERLKSLKADLDVLSLSATPIPRTLYMSLVGLRDVSQIMTPPEGRKPIQTLLQPYDPVAVREAVLFEIERGGKIYYIFDRIGSMGMRARTLQQLVPEARIGVAHGQMDTAALEEVMLAFEDGAYDILLATTIVESGLDISGANTLIIERADRLGLAQLYQLRGRVGRRETEAWAHLFYPGRLTEQAQRRLYAIAELNDLGSGHLLAEKDMEIRGVGNLLGPEQHGQIAAVSLEVYTEMLAEEIAKLKGEEKAAARPMVAIDLALDSRLSPSYIADDDQRIAFYGRFAETDSLAEVGRIARELREAYGPFPTEVKAFVELVKLRLLAAERGVVSIKEHMTDIEIAFGGDSVDYDSRRIRELPFAVEPSRYPPGFSIKKRGLPTEEIAGAISSVLYACG